MKKVNTTILLVGDNDLKCDKKEGEPSLTSLGFILPDLEKFHVISYQGKHGKKILKLKV